MSRNALGTISPTNSGSAMRQQTRNGEAESNRDSSRNLRDATSRMWRNVKTIPLDIRNIVYGFTSSDGRYKDSLIGPWPRVSRELARTGEAKYSDLMAPVLEHGAQLKREFFLNELPSLTDAEARQADAECAFRKAELKLERSPSESARVEARHAAIEEMLAVETVLEVVDGTPTESRA